MQQKIDSVEDIFDTNNQELFEETIGITVNSFKELCSQFWFRTVDFKIDNRTPRVYWIDNTVFEIACEDERAIR